LSLNRILTHLTGRKKSQSQPCQVRWCTQPPLTSSQLEATLLLLGLQRLQEHVACVRINGPTTTRSNNIHSELQH